MQVSLWMTRDPVTVDPKTPAGKALLLMKERKFRRLPVVEDDRLVGIVTVNDLTGGLKYLAGQYDKAHQERHFERMRVEHVMTPSPLTVRSDAPLEEAGRLMSERKIGGIPVVDQERLVGMLSESDLFRALAKMLGWGQPGQRFTVLLPQHGEGHLETILTTLHVRELQLQSLFTVADYSPTQRLVSFWTTEGAVAEFLEDLRQRGVQILETPAS